jgi:hypothetical protein
VRHHSKTKRHCLPVTLGAERKTHWRTAMRLPKGFRKFLHLHDDRPQPALLPNHTRADKPVTSNTIVPDGAYRRASERLSQGEGNRPRSISQQSRNTLQMSQRTLSSDRRTERNTYLSPSISTAQPGRQYVDSHIAPIPHESGLVKTGTQLVSNKVDCVVVLVYEGKAHRAIEERIWWMDKSQYAQFDYAADRFLRDYGVPHHKQLYRKSGQCSLIGYDDKGREFKFDSRTLENEEQWFEVLQILITSFVSKYPYVKFHLEIYWEYSDVTINRVEHERYAVTVRNVINGKLRANWQKQNFIPRKDLDEIMSKSTISELINSDTSLNHLSRAEKDTFINDVVLDATRLLAVCVFVKLPLACLFELMAKGCKDTDMPLTKDHCPHKTYNTDFGFFLNYQGGFIAHQFETNDGRPKHDKIPDDVVVPITFDGDEPILGEGGFGVVYAVRIDPDHHVLSAVSRLPFHSGGGRTTNWSILGPQWSIRIEDLQRIRFADGA